VRKVFLAIGFCSFLINFLFGQEVNFLPVTKLDSRAGFPSPNVRKIFQDKYNFFWFAAIDGLIRFDGINYTHFTAGNKKKSLSLLGTDVWDIVAGTGDDLWAITSGGLNKINILTSAITDTLHLQDNGNSLWLKCMQRKNNYIFIGSNEGIAVRFNIQTYKTEVQKSIAEEVKGSLKIDNIFIDDKNRVWLFLDDNGILITDTNFHKIKFIPATELSETFSPNLQFRGYINFHGNLLLATNKGLKIVSVDKISPLKISKFLGLLPVEITQHELSAITEKDGEILFCGIDGLFRMGIKKNSFEKIIPAKNYKDEKLFNLSRCIYQTDKGIMVSINGVAWIKNKNSFFVPYCSSMNGSGVELNTFILGLLAPDDSTLVAATDDGLYKINHINSTIKKYSNPDAYLLVFTGLHNDIIVSGDHGMNVFDHYDRPIHLSSVYPELVPYRNDRLLSWQALGDSLSFFVGLAQRGLYVWNMHKRKVEVIDTASKITPLRSNKTSSVYLDSKNRLWIIYGNDVALYNPLRKSIQNLNISLPGSIHMDVCEWKNQFWIASYGSGIIELDKSYKIKKVYGESDGLSSSSVFKIIPLNDSNLIVSSTNGLSVLNIYSKKISTYFEDDGLQSNVFDNISGVRYKNLIFLGGQNGFTKIDVEKFKQNTEAPNLYFLNTRTETKDSLLETTNIQMNELKIPNDWIQTKISFVGINYLNPQRVIYQYRIKESSDNWIDLGTQNFISLIGLYPGTYTLEVKAANEDGVWCEPKQLILVFEPKWFQTWWFTALVVIAVASLLYGFYRYRLMQIRKQHQIRKEIAGDLHDDIGATINSVKIFTHLAETSTDKTKYFTHIKDSLTQASAGLRDMIWVLDDAGDTAGDLFKRLQMFARPVTEASGVSISFNIDDTGANIVLNKTEKRNLLLIAKEAINNSIKYARCENISVTFSKPHNKTTLVIRDDGKGFSDNKITPGNGLRNMRERAHQVHYNILIESEDGVGTNITLVKK